MLLRSSSTPILNSWLLHCDSSSYNATSPLSPMSDHALTRSRSICLTSTFNYQTFYGDHHAKMSSEAKSTCSAKNHSITQQCNKKSKNTTKVCKDEQKQESYSVQRLFSSSWLGESSIATDEEERDVVAHEIMPQTLAVGGQAGNDGGSICGGGGRKGSDGVDGGDGDHGSNSAEAYYLRMIDANPGNALLLGNYAKYLKEVKGDMDKAEDVCGRAILANPTDGSILSLYAELIWNMHKDASRAESYYDQAVKSAPDDCYVLASYAKFLWDVEDEDADNQDDKESQEKTTIPHYGSPPKLIQESYHHRPITAAS